MRILVSKKERHSFFNIRQNLESNLSKVNWIPCKKSYQSSPIKASHKKRKDSIASSQTLDHDHDDEYHEID